MEVKQFPYLLNGKTLLYVHGFASSGQSGTVSRLRTVFPNARVIAPDLPIHPEEAMALLQRLCQEEQPDLIIGTSMGGMYTEQLYGYDRICVNPALCIADTMSAHGMTGTQTFQNPRQDGVQTFYVDKALVKEYRTVSERRFSALTDADGLPSADAVSEQQRVYGLFGDNDDLVDTFGLFSEHYPNALKFHGGHRMDDHSFMHSVVPVIRWIDDRQEQRERPIIYIGIEAAVHLRPLPKGGEVKLPEPASSFQKAVRMLIEHYQVYFVCPSPNYVPASNSNQSPLPHREGPGVGLSPLPWGGVGGGLVSAFLYTHINVPAWGHTVYTNQRHLLYGDYLIECIDSGDTMATRLQLGGDTFKTWDDLIAYFERLGGQ